MHPSWFEASLRRRIFGIVAATTPVAAFVVACGSSSNDPCKNSPCCGNPPPPETYTVTYTPCPEITFDASDDANDGDTDADVDADVDAAPPPVCFASCDQACMSQRPVNMGGAPFCQGTEAGAGDGGQLVAQCELMYLCGRRLDGLVEPTPGDVLAHAAWLEAASIHAFRRLARELHAHGAPAELVAAARSAAKDEARHARVMARLANKRGAKVPRVTYEDLPIRDLEAVARENAIEACVGETFGALLAEWNATHARDAELRDAMREIAPDEMRHAALGWAVDAWTTTRLSDDARSRVRAARDEAARELMQNTSDPNAKRLASSMHAAVWS